MVGFDCCSDLEAHKKNSDGGFRHCREIFGFPPGSVNQGFDCWRGIEGFFNRFDSIPTYHPSTYAKISGATMVASELMANLGVSMSSLPQVIFSVGLAPE